MCYSKDQVFQAAEAARVRLSRNGIRGNVIECCLGDLFELVQEDHSQLLIPKGDGRIEYLEGIGDDYYFSLETPDGIRFFNAAGVADVAVTVFEVEISSIPAFILAKIVSQ